jgi:hypothetical protein
MSLFETMEHSPYRAWCQRCAYRENPLLLSGFSRPPRPCDRCGNVGDLALIKMSDAQTERGKP